jgi:transcriptional regulator with XRE-family HTH domain
MMASVGQREVLRCDHCSLVQFRTANSMCRRCRKGLEIELPEPEPATIALVPPPPAQEGGLQVATAVRDLRHVRNLSQRQLAARMNVPRTYISKIENGKAIPTLGSLERLANALGVEMRQLVRDERSLRDEEVEAILNDPFLAEVAPLLQHLDSLHRTLFFGAVRDAAAGRRRIA